MLLFLVFWIIIPTVEHGMLYGFLSHKVLAFAFLISLVTLLSMPLILLIYCFLETEAKHPFGYSPYIIFDFYMAQMCTSFPGSWGFVFWSLGCFFWFGLVSVWGAGVLFACFPWLKSGTKSMILSLFPNSNVRVVLFLHKQFLTFRV